MSLMLHGAVTAGLLCCVVDNVKYQGASSDVNGRLCDDFKSLLELRL